MESIINTTSTPSKRGRKPKEDGGSFLSGLKKGFKTVGKTVGKTETR